MGAASAADVALRDFFAEVGIPTLSWDLARAMIEMSDESVVNYAKVAAVMATGPRAFCEGEDANEAMRGEWARIVFAMVTGHGITTDPESRDEYVVGVAGGVQRLTAEYARHAVFMWELFSYRAVAERFLAACPESVQAIARANVDNVWMQRFTELVDGV
jgi:hypothetical protein